LSTLTDLFAHRRLPRAVGRLTLFGASAAVLLTGMIAALPFTMQREYTFPAPRPFAGPALYNPYAAASGTWFRVNFHAHAHAWWGLTDGHQPDADVIRHYRQLGYDVAALSNYEHISRGLGSDSLSLPVYEHGYNMDKVHQLVIGARRVEWFDFPWHQSLADKQYVLDLLHGSGELVAVAHPELHERRGGTDFRYLTNYDLMEVRTHSGVATAEWDTALTTGHAVWALADDDTHDVTDTADTGHSWNMVNAASLRPADIIAALRVGHTYGVEGDHSGSDVRLASLVLRGDTLVVKCVGVPARFTFIGAGGVVLATVAHADTARFVMPADAPYVRTEVTSARATLYLNPVVRYDGVALARLAAVPVAHAPGQLAGLIALAVLMPTYIVWRRQRRRQAALVTAAEADAAA